MAFETMITDEAMEFLQSEALKAHAVNDALTYIAKDGTVFTFRVNAVYGSDNPELNDGFHAIGSVLLDENGNETDQVVFATRCTSGYPDAYANFDENGLGWPIFIEHKDDVLAWYNEQKNAGKSASFTGLSLGGALTQLFAGYVHQKTGDTLNSVVTFSVPGISASVITYEGETYDFTGKIAETVHHYMEYGDLLGQVGNYYLEGTIYIYACNYWLDQAGRSGDVIRLKDYILLPHGKVCYLLSEDYSSNPATVFVMEMDSSDMKGSWNPLSLEIESIPKGIENTNNTVVTVGDKTYLFNNAYAEIILSMTIQFGKPNSLDIEAAGNYIPRSAWEAIRGTETGRQDFFARALLMEWTSDVKVAIKGTFSKGGEDYAVLTLTGQTLQGKEFLFSFSKSEFVEIGTVVTDGNWQAIAGAQTYEVQFGELAETAGIQQIETTSEQQNKTYSTTVTNALIEELQAYVKETHAAGDTFEYTTAEGQTYRLKCTEFYGSDDPELNDGFHAAGIVLLDTDGTTETDEHFLIFRWISAYPDAFADFYEGAAGLPIFAEHTAEVLAWYEKYEGQNLTFSGSSLGCMLSQYFAGWLVNDQGKDRLTRLVGFQAPAIVKQAEYDDVTYHFITDKAVAETVEYYRQDGDIIAGFGEDYQKGSVYLYAGNTELDQAEGVRLHEYLLSTHLGEYLTAGSPLTYLGDFDTDYFSKDAQYCDLAVEVDAVPEGLENTNVEAVTVGGKTYLFNAEYADVALTFTSFTLTGESTASDFALVNKWETCRGSEKQELMTWLMMFNNKSDIRVTTEGTVFTKNGDDYTVLSDEGSGQYVDFLFNFTDKEFIVMEDVASDSITKGADETVTVNLNDRKVVINSAETEFETYNLTQKYTTWESKDGAEAVSGGIIQQQCAEDKTAAVQAVEDNVSDVIFAKANGTWSSGYIARHVGAGEWQGTRETVTLSGKNRISDLYYGTATDQCSVYLTDDSNGDALFLDDIYTELPDTVQSHQARVLNIDKFYAGGGDDIIDLTSQRYNFSAKTLEVHGGTGNDNLWAGSSSAVLLGEDGNDRLIGSTADDILSGGAGDDSLQGGGGNDIFTFGENWGTDTVEQCNGGKVTLWFAEAESKITAEDIGGNAVFTNGTGDGVTVLNMAVKDISCKFGDVGSDQYKMLASCHMF